jgi:hypothetical protein
MKNVEWKRPVIDVYGTPNQLQKTGDGPGHYIVCADFDGKTVIASPPASVWSDRD